MNKNKNYILIGGRVVDPVRGIDEVMDIGIDSGKITEPEKVKKPVKFNVKNLIVAPGFIDMHVHLRQPGHTKKENIQTGTMAAAAGGFTTIVSMPNTSPSADSVGTIEHIRRHTDNEGAVKVLPCGSMTKDNEGKEMAGIGSLKRAGVIAISDDGKCIQNHELMRHVIEYSKTFKLPVMDHCEDEYLAGDGVMHEGKWSTLLGLRSIPSEAEELMIARDIMLAAKTEWKVHIQHVSSRGSVELVRDARKKGIQISCEVTPHHLTLTDEEIKHFDTNCKMKPPLRSEDDRQALIKGLQKGTITVIASDHAPHTETEKMVEFDYAPFGIIGLETTVPVCLTELYHTEKLSISDLIAKFTSGPSEVLDIDSGLEPGKPADITLLDLDIEHVINTNNFFSKASNTPFNGYKAMGKAVATFVDGKLIYSCCPGQTGAIN